MKIYEFTLSFKLQNDKIDPQEYVDSLFENCNDALIGVGRKGQIALDFGREAESAVEALISAIKDVSNAIPETELIEVSFSDCLG